MSEKNWVPGFIELTQHDGAKYRLQIAQILDYSTGTLRDAGREITGSGITLVVGASERFVLETPEQIGELIRQAWEGGVSLQAEIRRAVESGEAE